MNKNTKKICNNLLFCFLLFVLVYVCMRVVIKYYNYGLFGALIEGNDDFAHENSKASKPKKYKLRKPGDSAKESINNIFDANSREYLDLRTLLSTHLDHMLHFSLQPINGDEKKINVLNKSFVNPDPVKYR